jgi:uncharacterized protein (DUF486 family)
VAIERAARRIAGYSLGAAGYSIRILAPSDRRHRGKGVAGITGDGVATASQQGFPMPISLSPHALPIVLLIGSNIFMTAAWYWHLRFKEVSLWSVILISWGLAFIEYCMAVPANRYGNAVYSAAQLKTMQEVITLLVFAAFSVLYLKEPFGWNHALGFTLIACGAFFVFHKW